ncbi:MAG: DUF1800 domain-containing protein [Acidobacteria bacterium]|nr:DUF1800 domain-containing protein [Acidobacteriota bacterium]
MLNRFSFGARPGEVESMMTNDSDGADKWFERQLKPSAISDRECERRMRDYPTMAMNAAQILETYPDRGTLARIVDGKQPYPTDPDLAAVYEVQVHKYKLERDTKQNASLFNVTEEQKQKNKEAAARIAADLYAMPKQDRMHALLKMPVEDRIIFTRYVQGPIRYSLLTDFTPREHEYFNAMSTTNSDATYRALDELAQATILRDILSERQLQAVMTDFWFNHFNIYAPKGQDRWYTTPYVRDAIRRNALGKFPDLLMATATNPAMMIYLDNWTSIGPDSPANIRKGKKGSRGLNENYAREVMELHTLSVNGGYSQADVIGLAAMLTGWSVDHPETAGPFFFDEKRHEPGTKQWLGQTIQQGGQEEGLAALKQLATSPKTAHFISWKLAQRFLADDPPASVVDKMAATYLQTDGDIKEILRTLVHSPEFNSRRYFRNKVKTPVEFVASVFRSTATDPTNPAAIVQTISNMGQPLYRALPPTGYYITADKWMNTSALLDRLNFALTLTSNRVGGQKFDSSRLLALGLMSQPAGASPLILATATMRSSQSSAHVVRTSQITSRKRNETGNQEEQMASGSTTHATGAGAELALSVLETSLIGGRVSAQTNGLILQQIEKPVANGGPATAPAKLDMLAAFVIGSPEFQQR